MVCAVDAIASILFKGCSNNRGLQLRFRTTWLHCPTGLHAHLACGCLEDICKSKQYEHGLGQPASIQHRARGLEVDEWRP